MDYCVGFDVRRQCHLPCLLFLPHCHLHCALSWPRMDTTPGTTQGEMMTTPNPDDTQPMVVIAWMPLLLRWMNWRGRCSSWLTRWQRCKHWGPHPRMFTHHHPPLKGLTQRLVTLPIMIQLEEMKDGGLGIIMSGRFSQSPEKGHLSSQSWYLWVCG